MKRLFDLIASLLILILTLPIFLCIVGLIKFHMGGNIFFFQKRIGFQNKEFNLIKFRTMANNDLSDDERITKLGLVLRNTSLDEIPELINVIKGEMSLVGPRPLLPEYLQYYNCEEIKRHNVKPGITGWAQINGRESLTWEQKFGYDLFYVNNHTFFFDFKILMITFFKVINRKDVMSKDGKIQKKFYRKKIRYKKY